MSCPYKYILGIPGQGFHAARFMGVARNDTIGTVVLALSTAWLFKINVLVSLAVWFIGGEVLHYAFGVQTAFLTMIGITACPKTELDDAIV
jgi:hypothetical protein